jgi:hypothetical protein
MILKEQVIVEVVEIEKPGEYKNFQIELPKNTKQIIGVETGIKIVSTAASSSGVIVEVAERTLRRYPDPTEYDTAFEIKKNPVAGILTLQSLCKENIFSRNDVYDYDRNIAYADFSFSGAVKHWTHCKRREELAVNVDGKSRVVEGYYKDLLGRAGLLVVKYNVYVSLWIEKYQCNERNTGN